MKKGLVLISLLLVLPVTLIGCATTSELEKVQAQQKLIDAKAEQAMQDAQAAKASADAAKLQADEATARAQQAEQAAMERERAADAAFKKSMKK
jgi:murein lipoprotein